MWAACGGGGGGVYGVMWGGAVTSTDNKAVQGNKMFKKKNRRVMKQWLL